MEHITDINGTSVNLMKYTFPEYELILAMLKVAGVETRITAFNGNGVTFQIRNPYKDNCTLFRVMSGEQIAVMSKKDITDGDWQR